MKKSWFRIASGAACMVASTLAWSAAEPPAPPEIPVPASRAIEDKGESDAQVEAQLSAARAQLEAAAHEVAELSTRLSKPWLDKLMIFGAEGEPPHALMGVQLDTSSDKGGARIMEVSPGGPAAQAGLKSGDVIVALNGTNIQGDETAHQVLHLMHDVTPDSKVKVRVLREGKPRDYVIVVGPAARTVTFPDPPRPPEFPADFGPHLIRGPLADVELASLTPQLGKYFGTDTGVLVLRAPKEAGFKLEDGDVILAIDGREPTSGSHATRILRSYQPGEKVSIKIMRQHKTLNVETTLPGAPAAKHRTASISREELSE